MPHKSEVESHFYDACQGWVVCVLARQSVPAASAQPGLAGSCSTGGQPWLQQVELAASAGRVSYNKPVAGTE